MYSLLMSPMHVILARQEALGSHPCPSSSLFNGQQLIIIFMFRLGSSNNIQYKFAMHRHRQPNHPIHISKNRSFTHSTSLFTTRTRPFTPPRSKICNHGRFSQQTNQSILHIFIFTFEIIRITLHQTKTCHSKHHCHLTTIRIKLFNINCFRIYECEYVWE